ncbi:MAG: DUF2442 domain-containing protein [Chitinophagaceae bacterium]
MSISNKIQNKRSSDPFDILIFEKGVRIKNVMIDKELDLMIIILNNGFVIKEMLSDYPSLKKATVKNLNNWRIISGGIGISWEKINEDLSLKGFLKNGALNETLRLLQGKGSMKKLIA